MKTYTGNDTCHCEGKKISVSPYYSYQGNYTCADVICINWGQMLC